MDNCIKSMLNMSGLFTLIKHHFPLPDYLQRSDTWDTHTVWGAIYGVPFVSKLSFGGHARELLVI